MFFNIVTEISWIWNAIVKGVALLAAIVSATTWWLENTNVIKFGK